MEYHALIIPAMIRYLGEGLKIAEKSMFALDVFCKTLTEEIVPYLD